MQYQILFIPSNQIAMVSEPESLLKICQKVGIMIDGTCAGNGTCGKCKVQILEGVTSPLSEVENVTLTKEEKKKGYRLACQYIVTSDLKVRIPDIQGSSNRKKTMNALPKDFVIDPATRKTFVKLKKATLEEPYSELEQLSIALKIDSLKAEARTLITLPQAIAGKRRRITSVVNTNFLLTAEADDTTKDCYGMAFDIGTTTVVGSLWDLNSGEMVDIEADTNPQSMYGSDVISRIGYCIEEDKRGNDGTKQMQDSILSCINQMVDVLCERNNIFQKYIYDMTVVGNTTMMHLFLGISPASLAKVPFAPVYHGGIPFRFTDLGIHGNPYACGYVLPNIAGHVGADITGVVLSTDIFSLEGNTIVIDIGTNGEILVAKDGRVLTCSTAAGPAFEGACIQHGMRAAKGAIEKVKITDDVYLNTIEDVKPCGICGSGLIDLIASMLEVGIMEENGNLLTQDMAIERGIPEKISRRLFGENQNKGFILWENENEDSVQNSIVITQKDIREVQLAKGAILGGMMTLMKKLDMDSSELNRVFIAGAFGSYINKASALRVGLLPPVSLEKVQSIGNAAGIGVSMALLNQHKRREVQDQVHRIEHIELSKDPDFEDYYIECMMFS